MLTVDTITGIRQTLADIKAHNHPGEGHGPDLYCLNLKAWLGDNVPALLAEINHQRHQLDDIAQAERAAADAEAARLDPRPPLASHLDANPDDLVPGRRFRRTTDPAPQHQLTFTLPCHPQQRIRVPTGEADLISQCRTCHSRYHTIVFDEGDGGYGAWLTFDPQPAVLSRAVR